MRPRSFLGSLVLLVVVTFVSGYCIGRGQAPPTLPAVVVCDSASWLPLDEPAAWPADRAQVCYAERLFGAPVRVVDLD